MDKKSTIIIIIFIVIILIGIIGLFFIEEKTTTDVVEINGIKYGKEEFIKYLKLAVYEREKIIEADLTNGEDVEDENNIDIKELKEEAYKNFINLKIYYQAAKSKGLNIEQDTIDYIENYYNSEEIDAERLAELGVTKEDFISIYKEFMLVQEFMGNIDTYYTLPEEVYKEYEENVKAAGLYNTYNLRTMQFNITTQEDGTNNRDEVFETAKTVMQRVKDGENFEELAAEFASNRLVQTNEGMYKFVNGELEGVAQLLIGNIYTDQDVYNAIMELEVGQYTELIETDEYFIFVKLEEINEGISDSDINTIKTLLTSDYAIQLINGSVEVVQNKIILNSIKFEIPEAK